MTRQLAAICGLVLSASLALAGQPAKVKEYDLASGNVTGDVVKGPRTIRAKGLNALRYDYRFNSAIAFSQPVDLWSKLVEIAAPPAAPTAPQSGAATRLLALAGEKPNCNPTSSSSQITGEVVSHVCAARDLEWNVNTALDEIKGVQGTGKTVGELAKDYQDYSELVRRANEVTGLVSLAGKALSGFLATTTGDSVRTVKGIDDQLTDNSTFMQGKAAKWPNVSAMEALAKRAEARQGQLSQLKSTLDTYSSAMVSDIAAKLGVDAGTATEGAAKDYVKGGQKWLNDANTALDQARKLLASVTSDNGKIAAGLPDLQPGSQKYNAFTAAHEKRH